MRPLGVNAILTLVNWKKAKTLFSTPSEFITYLRGVLLNTHLSGTKAVFQIELKGRILT